MTTGYFTIDPVMQRAYDIGTYAGALGGEAMYIGENRAAQFLSDTSIYQSQGTQVDSNNSLFGQQNLTSNNSGQSSDISQFMTTFTQFLQVLTDLIDKMFQSNNTTQTQKTTGTDTDTTTTTGTEEDDTKVTGKTQEEVAEERQEEVDDLLEKCTIKDKFKELDKELRDIEYLNDDWNYNNDYEWGFRFCDSKKIDSALKQIAAMSNKEFAAFEKYYKEKHGKELVDILTKAEKRGFINVETLDKIMDKNIETTEWLDAGDVKESENTEGKNRSEVAEIRQEQVDELLGEDAYQKKFERIYAKLEDRRGYYRGDNGNFVSTKDVLNSAMDELGSLSNEEYAAFEQYYNEKRGQGVDLDTYLSWLKGRYGVSEDKIDAVMEKDDEVNDWLKAKDIKKD